MLLYNTTYHVETSEEKNFLVWVTEFFIPEVEKDKRMQHPRLLRILSHQEEGSVCFSLQWEIENSTLLHQWHLEKGTALNQQLLAVFKEKVIGIPTLMDIIQ